MKKPTIQTTNSGLDSFNRQTHYNAESTPRLANKCLDSINKQDVNPKTKQGRILALLQTQSLNRFEAEKHGDHCLNSTISSLRSAGYIINDQWEEVPTRFGVMTRVKRYFLIKGASND